MNMNMFTPYACCLCAPSYQRRLSKYRLRHFSIFYSSLHLLHLSCRCGLDVLFYILFDSFLFCFKRLFIKRPRHISITGLCFCNCESQFPRLEYVCTALLLHSPSPVPLVFIQSPSNFASFQQVLTTF